MADANIPYFKIYEDGEPIPPVDPEDVKRVWELIPPWRPGNDQHSACSPGADVSAVSLRSGMIETLERYTVLTPWQHGEELDDAVFRVAATFPLRQLAHKSYMIEGDERFGFDPNAFVQRLIDETGVTHVWEPIPIKIAEGGRAFVLLDMYQGADPDKRARDMARHLLWMIWERCCGLAPLVVKENTGATARLFAEFVIENMDLLQVEEGFKNNQAGGGLPLQELEQRAQRFPLG
jgi:hypothetical protein